MSSPSLQHPITPAVARSPPGPIDGTDRRTRAVPGSDVPRASFEHPGRFGRAGYTRRTMVPPEPAAPEAGVVVEEASTVDEQLVDAFSTLVPQLSSSPPPGKEELDQIVRSEASVLLVARDTNPNGAVLGSLTLVVFRAPTGVRAWIEDVVVDEAARGGGIGEALVRHALTRATAAGARSVDLTSRPSREAANRLYQRLGFEERATNVYRWNGG